LTVLVYDQTRSAIAAALTFAASVVPTFAGGILLSGLADRLPRRAVMITCDVARMILVCVMAVAGIPLLALVALLFAVTMTGAPFTAARAAIYPEILPGPLYNVGTAITMTTNQVAQVTGFAAGGALAGLAGPRACLLADAATFAISGMLVRFGTLARSAPAKNASGPAGAAWDAFAGIRLVLSDPALRAPMLLGWIAAFYNAPEALAAPLARSLGGGAMATGLLLAFPAAGACVGALAFSRLLDQGSQARLKGPLAVSCCAALIPVGLRLGLPVTLAIFAASGACACFQVSANAAFVTAAPPSQRSQAFGIAGAGMSLGQGISMILAGAAAQHLAPCIVVSITGALGAVVAAGLTLPRPRWRTVRNPGPADS
jgi:MFS family permease